MKKRRLAKILEIIAAHDVETQEELQTFLRSSGFEVTQATISRDIKELRLVKELSAKGRYIYSAGSKTSDDVLGRTGSIFNESIIKVDYALNTVVITCFAGTAGAVCAAIDATQWNGVLGTIAGDDTIFVLCRNEENAILFIQNLESIINAKNT